MSWELRHRARTRRGEIAWAAFGEGPPVVLCHGTPSRSLVCLIRDRTMHDEVIELHNVAT